MLSEINITEKDAEALLGVARGKTCKEIGKAENIKERLYLIRKKLHVDSTTEAVVLMMKIAKIRKEISHV